MKINWKVRFANPLFWGELLAAVIVPVLAGLGLSWQEMTSWSILWQTLNQAVSNPVILAAVAVSVFNAVTDPTTKGVGDSRRALEYREPGE